MKKEMKIMKILKKLMKEIDKNIYINLDKELSLLSGLIEEIKERIPNIDKHINKSKNFKIEHTKRMLVNLMEKKIMNYA